MLFLFLISIAGCGRFDSQYTSVISTDEVSTLTVSCYNILGVPSMCIVTDATTKTIRIETVVTNIVERIVKKEVIIQVPIEKIITRIEKQYIETGRKVDIDELVEFILDRIKEFVKPGDIIDIPIDDIIDETTDYITNPPPPNEDKDSTTMGDIRDDDLVPIPPEADKKDTTDPNSKDDGVNDGTNQGRDDGNNPGGNTGTEPDGGTNNGGNNPGSTPGNNMGNEPDDTTNGSTPGNNDGSTPGNNDGSTPGNNMGTEPDGGTNNDGNNPGGNTGTEPDGGTNNGGNNPGSTPGNNMGTEPDDTNTGSTPGGNTGTEPDGGTNNDGNNPGGNTGTEPDGGTNDGGLTPGNITGNEPDGGTNNRIGEADPNSWIPPAGVPTIKLRVAIGPKKMLYQPYVALPGVSIDISCNIDGTIVHPSFDGFGVFRGNKWNLWGVQAWCLVPRDLDDSATTIHVDVSDFERWCGLTTGDVTVEKYTPNGDGTSSLIGSMDALIDLSPNPVPVCNVAPMFVDESAIRSVEENTPTGQVFGDPFLATDEDNDVLEYGLAGTDGTVFDIESSTSVLKTNEPLNYEVKNSYSVSVTVSDNKGGTDTIPVTINITDANDAPVFSDTSPTNRSVAENLAAGATVGNPVLATDEDNDTPEYSLSGTDADSFSIDSSSGQIRTSEPFDHEADDSYSVIVTADDNNGGTTNITVNISITDANDAPVFSDTSPTNRSVAENLVSASVGDPLSATDEDDDTLEYSLSGTDADSFSVDSSSGQIRTSKKLNYESRDTYSVIVTVDDNNGGTANITVNISVTDANDSPVFTEGFFVRRSVAENLAAGATIGDPVLATDEDGDTLEYSIASSNTDIFGVDSNSAQLSTKALFNHEERSSYSVTLSVTDNKGGTNGTFVTVSVTDANDAPVFKEGETALRAILESAVSGTNVGHAVSATDEDDDTLTYSISGTDASSFSLNTRTGRLKTDTTLDYGTQSSYSVTVSVTDNNGGTDEISVEIDVLEFYVPKQEFIEAYYAVKLDGNHLTVQCYTIRGYGYDGDNPIYVDNYYKFEDGSSEQTSTGWSSVLEENAISDYLDIWKADYSEEDGYTHGHIKASVHDSTTEAATKTLYQTICNAADDLGTWSFTTRGITYPDIDNNTSNGILDVATLLSYLEDDDCDPNN